MQSAIVHGLLAARRASARAPASWGVTQSLFWANSNCRHACASAALDSQGKEQKFPRGGSSNWRRGLAAAAGLGLATSAFASVCVPAWADSGSMQMQQTIAADNAARSSVTNSSPSGDSGPSVSSQESPGGGVLRSFSDAAGYAADAMFSLFEGAESRLSSLLQQSSDEPVAVRLVAFAAALVPAIVAFGLAYKLASGATLSQALYKMYCLLIRVEAGPEPNLWSYLVTNVVFLVGFFTLAVLLGVVNDEVQKRADDHRHGRNPVKASDHVLILNWNENTPALLQNIAMATSTAAAAAATSRDVRPWATSSSSSSSSSSAQQGSQAAASGARGLRGDLWSHNPAVVVLANKDKAEMDAAVQEAIRDRGFNLTVHTRQGQPFRPSQLKRVAAHEAAIVVLLHPEGAPTPADAEALKAAAAMAFTTLPARDSTAALHRHWKQQRMVVQMPASVPDAGNVLRAVQTTSADAADTSKLRVQVLSLPDILLTNRLVAQTSAQPGLLTVWLDLLAPDASSANFICLQTPADMQQQTYKTIRRSFSDDVVVGYLDAKGTVHLNPSDACVPGPGSTLVLLTRGTGALSPFSSRMDQQESSRHIYERAAAAAARRLRWGFGSRCQPRHIIVSSWDSDHIHELMRSFAEFVPAGSSVTFISSEAPPRHWARRMGNVSRVNYITHPYPTSMDALVAAGLRAADCVVLGTGSGHPTDAQADARVLSSLLQVQEAVQQLQLPKAPHVVAPICEAGSSGMALRYLDKITAAQQQPGQQQQAAAPAGGSNRAPDRPVLKPEFLIFRNITSAVVAQAASQPAYADIVTALLFNREGQEVYLRPPGFFKIPTNQPISFAEIQELARSTGQTAIGYISTQQQQGAADTAASSNAGGSDGLARRAGQEKGGKGQGGDAGDARRSGVGRLLPWAHSVSQRLSRAASVHLGLSAVEQVVLREGDWIVVLAEDF